MKLTKSRRYHAKMADYEWVEFGVEATLEDIELDDYPDALALLDTILEEAVEKDVETAHLLTVDPESFVHFLIPEDKKATN